MNRQRQIAKHKEWVRSDMTSLPELKAQSMKLEMEISDLLEQWREDHKDILDRKAEIDMRISEMEAT